MTKDEALKLALEALELHGQQYPHMVKGYCLDAITAIKEALAQHDSVQAKPEPEQEIVAWMYEQARFGPTDLRGQQWKLALSRLKPWTGNGLVRNVQALYTTPPQPKQKLMAWADLQKEAQQIVESKFLWKKFIDGTPLSNDIACWMADFAQQYTTPPQPEQEPVATVESVATVVSESGNQEVTMSWWHEPALPVGTKLYTTPPQRTWVGLTDEEYTEMWGKKPDLLNFFRQIEAKLKEKNCG